jgi:hypothetical protein
LARARPLNSALSSVQWCRRVDRTQRAPDHRFEATFRRKRGETIRRIGYIERRGAGDIKMDLNYLFFRQQVEKIRATTAQSDEARLAHEQLARRYESMIGEATSDEFHFLTEAQVTSVSP